LARPEADCRCPAPRPGRARCGQAAGWGRGCRGRGPGVGHLVEEAHVAGEGDRVADVGSAARRLSSASTRVSASAAEVALRPCGARRVRFSSSKPPSLLVRKYMSCTAGSLRGSSRWCPCPCGCGQAEDEAQEAGAQAGHDGPPRRTTKRDRRSSRLDSACPHPAAWRVRRGSLDSTAGRRTGPAGRRKPCRSWSPPRTRHLADVGDHQAGEADDRDERRPEDVPLTSSSVPASSCRRPASRGSSGSGCGCRRSCHREQQRGVTMFNRVRRSPGGHQARLHTVPSSTTSRAAALPAGCGRPDSRTAGPARPAANSTARSRTVGAGAFHEGMEPLR